MAEAGRVKTINYKCSAEEHMKLRMTAAALDMKITDLVKAALDDYYHKHDKRVKAMAREFAGEEVQST